MSTDKIAGVIIAGGAGSRMGFRDKPLLVVGGRFVLRHIIERAQPQVSTLLLNVNRNAGLYNTFNLPVVCDSSEMSPGAGPLAGIVAAMEWLTLAGSEASHIACFPGDTPWFPRDIVAVMATALGQDDQQPDDGRIAWIESDGQLQPLFSLWPLSLLSQIREAVADGFHSPRYFIESHKNLLIALQAAEPGMFLNINDPESLYKAQQFEP